MKVKGLCANAKILWSKEALSETAAGTGTYVAHQDAPSGGRWTAFFVDVQFTSGEGERNMLGWPVLGKQTFEFTSEVSIVPNTFPFPDCAGANCSGHLV